MAQQSQRVRCPAGYHFTRPHRAGPPGSPFTAAHSTHRAPKPPRSPNPPKSVLVTCCLPFITLVSTLFTFPSTLPCPTPASSTTAPSFCSPRKQGANPKLHSGPRYPRPQRAAFRIWQSRASLNEPTASPLSIGPVFLATPRHWIKHTNNPLYPIPAPITPLQPATQPNPHRAACSSIL